MIRADKVYKAKLDKLFRNRKATTTIITIATIQIYHENKENDLKALSKSELANLLLVEVYLALYKQYPPCKTRQKT